LADEMGMGKSLSILALAMKTLDDGQEWADELNIGPVGKRSIKHSRSTLIVVSSGCKIHGLSTPRSSKLTLCSIDHQLGD
jgi:hypothetical protein